MEESGKTKIYFTRFTALFWSEKKYIYLLMSLLPLLGVIAGYFYFGISFEHELAWPVLIILATALSLILFIFSCKAVIENPGLSWLDRTFPRLRLMIWGDSID